MSLSHSFDPSTVVKAAKVVALASDTIHDMTFSLSFSCHALWVVQSVLSPCRVSDLISQSAGANDILSRINTSDKNSEYNVGII